MSRTGLALIVAIGLAVTAVRAMAADYAAMDWSAHGVADPQRAWQNYALNCQGCHRTDGTGDGDTAPALAGHVSVFTTLPGGREYLSRVPGAATAPISDAELAELLNWALWNFDPSHVATGFKPYTAAEVGALRARPFRTEAAAVREKLLRGL